MNMGNGFIRVIWYFDGPEAKGFLKKTTLRSFPAINCNHKHQAAGYKTEFCWVLDRKIHLFIYECSFSKKIKMVI
jgi:hypothetical protein